MIASLATFSSVIETLGIVAFAMSGVFAALGKKLDMFGVLVIAFVTSVGGGTVRDLLIGATPVAWLKDTHTLQIILVTTILTLLLRKRIGNFQRTLMVFDALGLGLFTVIGIQKGLAFGLNPGVCVALGTISGCFGGVVRDILLNHIPALFHAKELYATTCIAGGTVYFLLNGVLDQEAVQTIAALVISSFRIISYLRKWHLPSL
ncbi:trimeric intracellular cation channel family protein [Mucilaginibacter corticis]|uniref:Trimeric intracellular cation channel family protein n=1 Tax=Mucilaginibacter corticis TaxID=2597670 RepID=A0A556MWT2_9SPHI|nr:trimeric intracellular cation channel family protein [Mucilaginibacter corticis]TSJ44333.1 trimeric intracellular cation channel family protein [Mucilaginibacter corticis]